MFAFSLINKCSVSHQELKVKFLINIPLKVDSEDEAQKRCRYLLDALYHSGFKEEDSVLPNDSGKPVLKDVAVIFGMNRKYSPDAVQVLKRLETIRYDTKIKYSIITYTWGSGGTIAQDAKEPPFQNIREHLKNSPATEKLVEDLRGDDQRCLVYFSFVDSDTFDFNSIYSEYLEIVREELKKDNIPPTVMSTGYEFHRGSDYHIASWQDRTVRVALAEVEPLFVYYPEPNFCVLVKDKLNAIEESFIQKGRNNMEAPILVSRVRKRDHFKAVFPYRKPIIIVVPERFKLSDQGLITGQSTLDGRNLAIGAYCNGVLTNEQTYIKEALANESKKKKGIAGTNRGFIIDLFNCKTDKEFEERSKKNPFSINGQPAQKLVDAVKAARECKMFIYDLNEKLIRLSLN